MRDVSRQFFFLVFFHPSILSDFISFRSHFISVLFFGTEKLNGNKKRYEKRQQHQKKTEKKMLWKKIWKEKE